MSDRTTSVKRYKAGEVYCDNSSRLVVLATDYEALEQRNRGLEDRARDNARDERRKTELVAKLTRDVRRERENSTEVSETNVALMEHNQELDGLNDKQMWRIAELEAEVARGFKEATEESEDALAHTLDVVAKQVKQIDTLDAEVERLRTENATLKYKLPTVGDAEVAELVEALREYYEAFSGYIGGNVDLQRKVVATLAKHGKLPTVTEAGAEVADLVKAYEAWIQVVLAEHSELVSLAFVHGWKSTRIEEGKRLREELDAVLADYHKESGPTTVGEAEFDQIMGGA